MTVRLAERCDVPTLVQWASEFHALSPYRHMPLDLKATADWLRNLIHLPSCVIFMTNSGAIGGSVFHVPRLATTFLQEEFWHSAGGRDGVRLFKALRQWGRENGADQLSMISLPDSDKIENFYTRQGLERVETRFMGNI